MQKPMMLMLLAISISLSACSTTANVVPRNGATMEQVYDAMGKPTQQAVRVNSDDLTLARQEVKNNAETLPSYNTHAQFKKLKNPELTMMVYPHLAGNDEVPIPGYTTAFNAYEHDHYALPQDE